jgi:hypothetical protein
MFEAKAKQCPAEGTKYKLLLHVEKLSLVRLAQ